MKDLLERLFKRKGDAEAENVPELEPEEPVFRYEDIPDTLDLGWYFSEGMKEFQMAKVAQQDRATHLYVIGASGSGKTKFLEFLIQQDIQQGNGFAIIDPHGDLVEDIKGFLACYADYHGEEVFDRVVVVDPTDPRYTAGFNPLERLPGVSVAEQASELISAFRKIWADSWGSRMEDLLRNSLIALGEAGLTLVELPRFLTSQGLRRRVLQQVSHPVVRDYFQRFDTLTDRARITWIEPVTNKINALLADERVGQLFASPKSTFQLREVMDSGKVLLVKLDKGRLRDSADLLGSLVLAKIKMAAFSRSDVPARKRRPFHLYIDEFQNFATDSFSVMLSEARKYGLCLVMAHQTLAQVSSELRHLVLGNTGIQVYFRVGHQDAQILANEAFIFSPYDVKSAGMRGVRYRSPGEQRQLLAQDIQDLPPRVCYVKHKIEGGLVALRTVDIEPADQVLGLNEDDYPEYLANLPIGQRYVVAREKLVADIAKRFQELEGPSRQIRDLEDAAWEPGSTTDGTAVHPAPLAAVRKERKPASRAQLPPEEQAHVLPDENATEEILAFTPKSSSQHRYLQALIKRVAEERGFRATIEQPTSDGQGRVDVGLERDGKRIACEISMTTTDEHELSNIEKCLRAGYDTVILCSPERRTLDNVKALASQRLSESDQEKVLFFQPEELFFHLEQEAASSAGGEGRVKGYKVNVRYQPVADAEKKAKREAVGKVILQAMRRLKGKGSDG